MLGILGAIFNQWTFFIFHLAILFIGRYVFFPHGYHAWLRLHHGIHGGFDPKRYSFDLWPNCIARAPTYIGVCSVWTQINKIIKLTHQRAWRDLKNTESSALVKITKYISNKQINHFFILVVYHFQSKSNK